MREYRAQWYRAAIVLGLVLTLIASACGVGNDDPESGSQPIGDSTGAPDSTSDDPSESGESDALDDQRPGDATTVTAEDLAALDCPRLIAIVDKVVGPGERSGRRYSASTLDPSVVGGCEISGEGAVAIEIHLASQDDGHSTVYSLFAPISEASRQAARAPVGDEAYFTESGPGLLARKGFVEVLFSTFNADEDDQPLTIEQITAVAAEVLAPFPSGPGAQEASVDRWPPVPMPDGSDPKDWSKFDPTEVIEELPSLADNPDLSGELMVIWTLPFMASDSHAFCDRLQEMGFTKDNLVGVTEGPNINEPDEVIQSAIRAGTDMGCFRSDGRWIVLVVPMGNPNEWSMQVWSMQDQKRQLDKAH